MDGALIRVHDYKTLNAAAAEEEALQCFLHNSVAEMGMMMVNPEEEDLDFQELLSPSVP